MYKLIYLARRNPTVRREDWPRTWRSHAVFASQFPVLEANIAYMRYCNHIDNPTLAGRPVELPSVSQAHDGVAIACSDTLQSLNGAAFSPEDRARIDQDELRVFDMLTPAFSFYCTETVIRDGRMGEAAVFQFLPRKATISPEAFEAHWDEHTRSVQEATQAYSAISRYAHNRPIHEPPPLFPFDAISECWYPSAEDAARSLSEPQFGALAQDLGQFCDLDRSVTLLTKVCHRWPRN